MTLFELEGAYMYRRFLVLAITAGCALTASNAVAGPNVFAAQSRAGVTRDSAIRRAVSANPACD
jgi:hypothetical protein